MHLGLYEISLSGHHGAYVKAISQSAARKGWKVTLVLPEREARHPSFRSVAGILGPKNVIPSPYFVTPWKGGTKMGLLAHHFAQHRAAVRSLEMLQSRCDFIYTSNINCMDKAILVMGSPSSASPLGGMCMRVRFHMSLIDGKAMHSAKMVLGESQLRRVVATCFVTTADPVLFDYCQSRGGGLRRVRYVPEIGMAPPTITRAEARAKLDIGLNGRVILVYGALSRKKALAELVSATRDLPGALRITILAVGQPDREMSRYLDTEETREAVKDRRLICRGGFADQLLEATAFAAADLVWVAYKDAGSMSGVFSQAMCSGLPVIAPNHGILRWLTLQHDVGTVVDPDDAVAVKGVLAELFSHPLELTKFRLNAKVTGERHFPWRFGDEVCNALSSWLYPAEPRD